MAGTLPADKRRQGSFLLRLFGCFSSASVAGRTSISQSIITAEASKSETGESEGAASKQQPESSEVFSNLEAQHREDCGSARDESGAGSKMDKAGKEANVNIQLDADALDLAEGSLRCSPAVEQESHLPSCFSDSRRGQEGYDQSALFSIAERCECSMPDLPQVATGTQQRNSPPPQDKSIHYEVAFTGPNSSTAQSLSASFDDAASQLPSILVLDSDAPSAESSGFTRSSGVGSLFGLDSPVSEAFKHFQGIQFSVASSYNTADNSLNNSLVKTASLVPAVVTALASHSNTADISNSSLMGAGPHASIGRQGSTVTDRSPSKSLRPIRYLSDSGVGAPGSSKAPIPQLGVYNYLFSNCKLPLGGRTSAGIPVARASLPSTSQIKLASELGSHVCREEGSSRSCRTSSTGTKSSTHQTFSSGPKQLPSGDNFKSTPREAKPIEIKLSGPKPSEAKLSGPKLSEAKLSGPKPSEAKLGGPKPSETKLSGPKPSETKPIEPKPLETKPSETGAVNPSQRHSLQTQTQPSSLGPHTSTKWNRSAAQLRLLDSPNGGVHGVYTNLVGAALQNRKPRHNPAGPNPAQPHPAWPSIAQHSMAHTNLLLPNPPPPNPLPRNSLLPNPTLPAAAAAAAPGSPSGAVDGKEWPGFTHMPLQLAPAPLLVVPLSPSPAHVNQTTSLPLPGVAASQSANRLDPAGWVATSNEHAFASERASDRSDSDVVVSASFFLLPADGERGWYDPQGGAGTGLQGSGYRVSFGSTQASSSGRISISVTRSDSKNGLFLDAVLGASTSGRFAHSLSRSKSDSTLDTTSLGSNVSLWAEPTPTSTPTPMPTPMSTSIPTPMSTSQVPVISRVSAVRPRQTQPSMDEPSTAQPRTVHPVQNQPSSAQPSTLQPRQTPPSVAEPSTAQPRQTQPSTAQLRTLQRSQGQASPAEPPMGESSRSHPSVSSPSTDEHRKRVPGEASQASLSYPPPTKQVSEGDLPGGLGFDVLNVQGKWNQSDLYACRPDHTTNAGNATTAQSIRTNAGNATTAQSIPTNTGNPCNQVQDARLAPCLCGKQGQATTLTVDGHQGAQGQATTPGLDGHQGTQGQATSGNRGSNRTPQGQATFGLRGSGSGAQGQATTAAAGMVSNQGPSNDALSLSQDPNPEPCRVHKQDPNPLDPASMVTQQELSNDALSLSQAPNLEPCRVHKQDPNPLDSASMVSKQELSKDALSLSQAPHLEPCRMHKQDPNPLDPASMVSKQELSNDALSMSQAPNLEPHCVDKQAPNSLDPASMVSKQELSNAAPSQSQATSPQAKPSPHAASQDPTPQAKPRPHAASQDPTPQAKPSTHGASQAPTLAPYVARKKLLKARGPTKVANPVPSRDDVSEIVIQEINGSGTWIPAHHKPPSEELQQKIKVRRSFKSDPKPGSGRDSIISSWAGSKRSIQVNLMESQRGAQQLRQGQATMESPRGAQPLRQCQATLESQRGAQPLRQGQATMESPRGNQPLRQCQATLESQRGAEQLRQGQATLESQRGAEQLQQGQATKGPQAPLPHQKQGGLGLPPSGGGPAPPRSQEGRTRDTKGGKGRRGGEWKSVCVSAGGPREEGSSVYSGRTACKEGARVERKAARMGYMLRSKLTGLVYELSKAGTGRSSAAGSGVAPLARSGVVPSAGRCVVPSAGSGVVPSAQSGVVPSAGSGVAPPGGVAPQSGAPPRSAGGAATHHSLTKREPSNLPSFTDPLRPSGPPSGHPSVTDLLQLSGHPSGHPSVTNLLHPSVTDLLHPSGPPSAPPSGPPSVTDLLHPSAPPSPNMLDGSASNSFRPFSFNPPVLEQSKTCTHETAASSASSQQQQQWEQQRQRLSQTRSSKDLSQAQVPPASSASSHHQQQQWQQQQHQPLSHTRMSKDLSPPQESPASAASSHQQQRQQRSDTRSSKDLSHAQESPASSASSHQQQQQWQQQRSDTRSSNGLSHAQESPAAAASSQQQQQQWQQQQHQLSQTRISQDLSPPQESPASAASSHQQQWQQQRSDTRSSKDLSHAQESPASAASSQQQQQWQQQQQQLSHTQSFKDLSHGHGSRGLHGVLGGGVLMPPVNQNGLPEPPRRVSSFGSQVPGTKFVRSVSVCDMALSSNCSSNPRPGRGLLENSNNSNYSKNSNYSNNSNGSKGCPTEQTLNEMMYDSGNSIQAGSSSRAGTNHKAWQRGGRSGVAKLAPVVASVDDDEDSEDSDKDSPSFKGSKISRYPLTKQRSTWRTMFEPMNLALSARESNDMR